MSECGSARESERARAREWRGGVRAGIELVREFGKGEGRGERGEGKWEKRREPDSN